MFHISQQLRLVAFNCDQVIPLLIDYRLTEVLLAKGGVDYHQFAFQNQVPDQFPGHRRLHRIPRN